MTKHFTHLHLHTEYSLLDGAISLKNLIQFGKENELKALAISDHGNIFGAVKFFDLCKKEGIKPVLGIEAYLTEDVTVKKSDNRYYHIVIIVKNDVGYRNLCKLIAFSYQEGFYFKPRIDYRILETYSDGLIVTSGCLGGHIPQLLKANNHELVEKTVDWYRSVFGTNNFFLEIQPEDQQEQIERNKQLIQIATNSNIPLLATGDCHYVSPADHEAHEVMLSIQTHSKMSDANRMSFGDARVPIRPVQEMLDIFPDHPEAIWNSGAIADRCEFDFERDKLFFPNFEIPQEHTQESFFKYMCQSGLERLIAQGAIPEPERSRYQDRLTVEMDLIITMGFIGYFLVVSDFIQWAYRNEIPVGPGRGSAAGSLVAWTLQITNIDPLKYNLLFERFLNPERVTMPDIDIDFCIEGRENVIDYVRDKYGHDNVCQIITFGTMMAKGVIKDVARVLGIPFEDSNAITNLIPDQLKITLSEALEQEPRLQELIDSSPQIKKLFDLAFRLEGLTRHASKHAAGIVISPEKITDVLPVYIPPKTNELVTQYAMTELESIGFLKIDFLGLKNLTLIKRAVDMIRATHDAAFNVDTIALDDEKTFALIGAGKTSGVFQLESDGLKEVLRKLRPSKFEDIIAVNALYRPGPLGSGMVDDFIERRHGRQNITYLIDDLAEILEETYGVIVYQEQVMKIASSIGGYSLGEADILRRAMGKKKADIMAEHKHVFSSRAQERGYDKKKAYELFDLMAYFAGYGFNKSHSAAYALIAYQTAYLKAHYPAEFLACLISLESSNADKMAFYLQETQQCDITVLPPNINESQITFTVKEGAIVFGLQGIKNVGMTALENIITEREKNGPFKDILDFCTRIDLRTANKRVVESLICAGAFDTLHGNRAQKITELHHVLERAIVAKREKETGQMGLFGAPADATKQEPEHYAFQPLAEWSSKEKLDKEKEVIGFYISEHPLDSYKEYLGLIKTKSFRTLLEITHESDGQTVGVGCGLLAKYKTITTKKGDRMAFAQFEDTSGECEVVLFPRIFKQIEPLLAQHQVFLIKGNLDASATTTCKMLAQELVPLEELFNNSRIFDSVRFMLPNNIEHEQIKRIKQSVHRGSVPLSFVFTECDKQLLFTTNQKIALDLQMIKTLKKDDIRIQIVI